MKEMTIVIAYEGDCPVQTLGQKVLGCDIVALSLRNECELVAELENRLELFDDDDQ